MKECDKNNLIMVAKYMGCLVTKPYSDYENIDGNIFYYPKDTSPENQRYFGITGIKYHYSMDWLYPVAKKVKNEMDVIHDNSYKNDTVENFAIINDLFVKLDRAALTYDVGAIYEAVVDCLLFLNKEK